AMKSIAQLTNKSGTPPMGWNAPKKGKNGTVYIASEIYKSQVPYAGMAIAGIFVHELGNILDAELNPSNDGKYEAHYGNKNSTFDKDTGFAFQLCVFGTFWTPGGKDDTTK